MNSPVRLTAAAIQMISQDGNIKENLDRAETFLKQAAEKGATLIVFPEFMPLGYRLTRELWDFAESMDGNTVTWLKRVAKQYGVYVGTSFLERAGNRYYNTFALTEPGGTIAGCVRKRNPSIWEAYFFQGYRGKQYIDTPLGRIGVGICFDNHTYEVGRQIAESNVDIMLMPHSYCIPTSTNKMVSREDLERLSGLPSSVARLYNQLFGIPVILVNKSGAWDSPLPTNLIPKMDGYAFSGRSCVICADGTIAAELDAEEGIALAEVQLNPAAKKQGVVPKYSRYLYPGPAGREITRVLECFGKISYFIHRKR